MDIKDVGANLDRTSRVERSPGSRARARTDAPPQPASDFFENSGRIGEVRALIEKLVQVPEIRTDVVDRARGLLESGAIDDPRHAEQAAAAFLEGAEGGAERTAR